MAKPAAGTYEPNKRVMLKVKHERECDCVVAGFRWHKGSEGHRRRLAAARPLRRRGRAPARRRLRQLHRPSSAASWSDFLAPYRENALASHPWKAWAGGARPATSDGSAGPARRAAGARARTCRGSRCAPELVVEVAYDHMQGTRFRHTAQFRRWRTDKPPRDCTFAQLEVVPPHELAAIFATGR